MPKLKLTYFDMNAGRGESCRLAMAIGKLPFEDVRIPFTDWPDLKASTPFGQLPVLEVDGRKITQTNAINRYVGRRVGLYPEDPLEAARCDEITDALEDIAGQMGATFRMSDEAQKKAAREMLAAGPIPLYLKRLGEMLEAGGGEYFAGARLSVADLRVFLLVRHLRSGLLDYMPSDLPETHAPNLVKHFERINAHPAIVDWYSKH